MCNPKRYFLMSYLNLEVLGLLTNIVLFFNIYFLCILRSLENSTFVEDFSDVLLLRVLNSSVTAAADNEKVCINTTSQNASYPVEFPWCI